MNLTNTHTIVRREKEEKLSRASLSLQNKEKKSGTRFCQGFKIYLENGFYMGFNWNMVKVY